MRRAVLWFLCRALVMRSYPTTLCLSSQACFLNSLDHQEPSGNAVPADYRSQCLLPLITLAVRTSNWNAARKISFRECVGLYGLPQSVSCLHCLCNRSCRGESERSSAGFRAWLITVEMPGWICLS
uniref:Secreted protein n=1 Tax=Arundo donax TaxID=35708 RepID=A0A0A9DSX0_ARUDO